MATMRAAQANAPGKWELVERSSMNEIIPFSKATEAYAYMLTGKARFRIVMTVHD